MSKTFSAFPDISIPAFMQEAGWDDNSWRNDVHPKGQFPLALPYEDEVVRVWVAPAAVEDREYPECPRFIVEHVRTEDEHTDGQAPILYQGESEVEAAEACDRLISARKNALLKEKYAEAMTLLLWVSENWREGAIREYTLSESFDEVVHKLAHGVVFHG